jgi:predicted metal-dependent hydrolase
MKKAKSIVDGIIGFVSNPRKVIEMADTINDSYRLMINTKEVYSKMKENPEDFLKKAASSVLESTTRVVERKMGERYDYDKREVKKTTKKW